MSQLIISNTKEVNISLNEYVVKATINRNVELLLNNDVELKKFVEGESLNVSITSWKAGIAYNKNDVVWYRIIDDNDVNLYLLKSLLDNNTTEPRLEIVDGEPTFEKSHWKDLNFIGTITNNDKVRKPLIEKSVDEILQIHETNEEYHSFGKLETEEDLESKVLKKDLSNIDSNRESNFFPYITKNLTRDNVIKSGFYRQWDNGLIEYTIIFKLGFHSNVENSIYANELLLLDKRDATDNSRNDNYKYFLTEDDMNIFNNKENVMSFTKLVDGSIVTYRNVNKTSNAFSGKITFPIPFKDLNYMCFANNCELSYNNIIFTNKSLESITALYIKALYDGYKESDDIVLSQNEYSCQIIGRWK